MPYDFFLSYCRHDWDFVVKLDNLLANGPQRRTTWWDKDIHPASSNWRGAVADAILESQCVVVLVTQNSLGSAEVLREAQFAYDEKKLLVAIVLGDLDVRPGQAGLIQFFSTHNQCKAKQIERDVAVWCCQALVRPPPTLESQPRDCDLVPHYLAPIEIDEAFVPSFRCRQGDALHEACEEVFRRSVLQKDWNRSANLLEAMKDNRVLPGDFEVVEDWHKCVCFYQSLLQKCSWSEVVEALVKAPNALREPIARQSWMRVLFQEAWMRVVEDSCEKVYNCLSFERPRDGSFDYARRHFHAFEVQYQRVLESVFGATSVWEDFEDLYDWALQTLRAYEAPGNDASGPEFVDRRWPPTTQEITGLDATWETVRTQRTGAARFVGYLVRCASNDTQDSSIKRLIRRLETVGLGSTLNDTLPEIGVIKSAASEWEEGLRLMLESVATSRTTAMRNAAEHLENAAKVFPGAHRHADLVREWSRAYEPYLTSLQDLGGRHSIVRVRRAAEAALRAGHSLLGQLVEPYCERATTAAIEGRLQRGHQDAPARFAQLVNGLKSDRALLDVLADLQEEQTQRAIERIDCAEKLNPRAAEVLKGICNGLSELRRELSELYEWATS